MSKLVEQIQNEHLVGGGGQVPCPITELKSISFGSPLLRRRPFEFSFKARCDGVPKSAKNMPMSCLLLTFFILKLLPKVKHD